MTGPESRTVAGAPTSSEWRARGNAALGKGDLAQAGECYRQATLADPRDPLPWLNLGVVHLESARWSEAEESLARAISLRGAGDDFLHDAHYLLGRAHQQLADNAQAMAD